MKTGHGRQGKFHVSRQLEIIADMQFRNQPTDPAENLNGLLPVRVEPSQDTQRQRTTSRHLD